MSPSPGAAPALRFMLGLAAFVVIVAGMHQARSLLVPFLLSVFIAVIAAPALFYLRRHRVPTALALLLVILGIGLAGVLLGALIGSSVNDFATQLPDYQAKLRGQAAVLTDWMAAQGLALPEQLRTEALDPGKLMGMAARGVSSLGGLLTDTFLILITVIFILVEASSLPEKLRRALDDPENDLAYLNRASEKIKHYMAIKTATSLLTGAAVALWLQLVGVDFPVLWGTVAFLLNFVPNIGSIIAAIPAVLLALIQLGTGGALWALAGYAVINNLVGNFVEPRFMGRGLGLSPLVVFLSLIFWGWVLGTVGMFLSVPLTMAVKIALDSREETRWLAILLGPDTHEPPPKSDGGPPAAQVNETAGPGRE